MDRTAPTERLDLPRQGRRKFLKQIATTGAAAAAGAAGAALPAFAQGKPEQAATQGAPAGPPLVAETLARYATSLKYEDLPPDVVRVAKRIIIDSIGCGIGAFSSETSQIANKLAAGVSAVRGATVLCSGLKTSPELAVFANGTMIRYLDFNDGYISLASGHPSDSIASVLSTAELAGRGGRDLITGTVLAYEVFCRVLDVFDSRPLGLDAATVIGLAATAAGGRMMGLTQQELVHAIGIRILAQRHLRGPVGASRHDGPQ
jgi:2-methylcitrate dehydratase